MKNLIRLLVLFKPYSGWVLSGILLSLITLSSNIALMAISGWFIASMAIAGMAGVSMNYFSPAAMIRGTAIFRTAGRYAERLVTHEATFRLISVIRVWFYKHLEPLVPVVLEDYRAGDLFSRIRADIDMLDNFYIRIIVPLSVAFIGTIMTSLVMLNYDVTLALTLLLMLSIAGILLPFIIARLGLKPGQAVIEKSKQLRTDIIDGVQGMAELTVCGALEHSAERIQISGRQWIQAQKTMGRVSGLSQSGLLFLTNLALWLVVLLAIPMVAESIIEPAELAMLALFTLASFETVMPLPEAFRLLGQIKSSADRLFEIIDRKPLVSNPLKKIDRPDIFDLQFNQVCFSYKSLNGPVLRDLSFQLKKGKKTAIIGPSGSGKSSLIQLILRYQPVDSGTISLSGQDISCFSSEQCHDMISVVPQHTHLFNSSIRDNLLIACPSATQHQLNEACKKAKIHDFIIQQPEGYDTWVGETGVKLSGGQTRRLSIARALLRDFDLLVLDEPGEGLDAKTEYEVIHSLVESLDSAGLLLITHSPTGLSLMDEIIILEQGVCSGKGSFNSLKSTHDYLSEMLHFDE